MITTKISLAHAINLARKRCNEATDAARRGRINCVDSATQEKLSRKAMYAAHTLMRYEAMRPR